MSTKTREKTEAKHKEVLSQPYVLILHNDDFNEFSFVIECLMKVCKHEYEQASQCAHMVHMTGKCDVKRGDLETITEMYNKLKSAGLSTTMEMV